MLLAAGPVEAVASSLPDLGTIFHEPVVTLERVRLCKRDGVRLADPLHVAERDDAGLPVWQEISALQRNVPVHTVIVDTPDRVRQWWPVVDEVTAESGLVTSEPVPPPTRRQTRRSAADLPARPCSA